jgi:autotransporter-associated beta strand protein
MGVAGSYSFAAGQPAVVTLAGTAGTLSADAVWFEPVATLRAPRDLVLDVGSGVTSQAQAGRGWIGPEWSSLTKTGSGALLLDRANALSGPVTVVSGSLRVTAADALAAVSQIAVATDAVLDVSSLVGGYQVPPGQVVAGTGTVGGTLVFGRGATLSPGLDAVPMPSGVGPPVAVPEPVAVAPLGVAAILGLHRWKERVRRRR